MLDRSAALYAEAYALEKRPEWLLARAELLGEVWSFADAVTAYESVLRVPELAREERARAEEGLGRAKSEGARAVEELSEERAAELEQSLHALLGKERHAEARALLLQAVRPGADAKWFDDMAVLFWLDGNQVEAQKTWARGRLHASNLHSPEQFELMPPLDFVTWVLSIADGHLVTDTIEEGLARYDHRRRRYLGLHEAGETPRQIVTGPGRTWVARSERGVNGEGQDGRVLQVAFDTESDSASETVGAMALTADRRLLAWGGSDGGVRFVAFEEVVSGGTFEPLPARAPERKLGAVRSLAFDPSGRQLAAGHDKGTIRILTHKGRELARLTGHANAVIALSFDPTGARLFSGSADRTLRSWDVAKKVELAKTSHSEPIHYVRARGPSEVDFASRLSLYRANLPLTAEPVDLISGPATEYDVFMVADAPDGSLRATSHYKSDTIQLWDPHTGAPKGEVRADNEEVLDLRLSKDGRWFAVAAHEVHLFDLQGSTQAKLALESASAVAFSPDGRTLAGGGFGGHVVLWDVATRRERRRIPIQKGHPVDKLDFSPDGQSLAVEVLREATLYDLATGKPTDKWSSFASFDYALDVLAVTTQTGGFNGSDPQIHVLERGRVSQPLHVVEGGSPLDLADESKWLAARRNDEVVVWDDRGNEKLQVSAPDLELLALSPSGKSLAVGQRRGWITVLDTSTKKVQMSVQAHRGLTGVSVARWSADGQTLVTGGHDGIKVWAPARSGDRPVATMRVTTDGWYLVAPSASGAGRSITAGFSKAVVSDIVAVELSGGFHWEALRDDSILANLLRKGSPR